MYIPLSNSVKSAINSTYWSRGSSYKNKVHSLQALSGEDYIAFAASIRGTSLYQSNIQLLTDGKMGFHCTCLAYNPRLGCKHIAGLARKVDTVYNIDDYLTVTNKNGQYVCAPHNQEFETPPESMEDTQDDIREDDTITKNSIAPPHLTEYMIRPDMLDHMPPGISPDDSELLHFLFQKYPTYLVRKDEYYKKNTPTQHISPILSVFLPKSDTQNTVEERHFRIKLEFQKTIRNPVGKHDVKMHICEAKLLKNGALSTGKQLFQEQIHGAEIAPYKLFADAKYSYYEPAGIQLSFQSAPERFMELLIMSPFSITTTDNKPIKIESFSGEHCEILVEKGIPKKDTYTLQLICRDNHGKQRNIHPKSIIVHAPHTHWFGAFSPEFTGFFFVSSLPESLILELTTKPLVLTETEWQAFRQAGGLSGLLDHVSDLGFLESELIPIDPKLRLIVEIPSDFESIQVSYDFLYNSMRVHPRSTKKVIENEGTYILRDREKESILREKIVPLMQLSDEQSEKHATITKYIDEHSDAFFDIIESLLHTEILIEYRQPTKRVSHGSLSSKIDVSSGQDWFDLSVEFTLGDTILENAAEVLRSLRKGGRYITLDNGTVIQLKEEMHQTLAEWNELGINEKNINSTIKLDKHHLGLLKNKKGSACIFELPAEVKKLQDQLTEFKGITKQKVPKTAMVELRTYQKQGYDWLHFLHEYHFSGILADDMGLGKTIQTLIFLESLYGEHRAKKSKLAPTLIIVPTSLVLNWMDEAAKFVPDMKVWYIRDSKMSITDIPKDIEIIIVSYGILANLVEQDGFISHKWYYKAQNIKNSKSERCKAVLMLQSSYRLALSGTPIENNLLELQSIFQFLMPGFIGNESRFKDSYMKGDTVKLELLSRKVKPFILRRTKEKVLKDLPAKQEEIIHLEMGEIQRQFYDALKTTFRAQITEKIATDGMAKSQFAVLDALLKLRQASLMPALVSMDGNTVQESTKLQYLEENIEDLLTRGHTLLIFSQFTGFLAHIKTLFDTKKIDYNYLDGQTSRENRKKLVDSFNAGKVQVFLISLKAGGVGLNLTGADYVIHMDPWWNPAVENQATDRAHRMGQTKTVFVQKLIVRDTVEEKILKLQEKKKKLIDDLFSGDFKGKLNEEDVKYIFE